MAGNSHHHNHHKKYHKVIANNDKYTLDEDTVNFAGNVSTNDRDTKGHDLDFKVIKDVQHGTLNLNTETGAFTYTPDANFYGTDYFKYKAYDEYGKWDWAVVKLCVEDVPEPPANQAPVAEDDVKYKVKETKKLYGDLKDHVNDPDGTDAALTFTLVDGPDSGKFRLNTDGTFHYKPERDKDRYDEEVTFTYKVADAAGGSDTATVTICIDDNWGKKHHHDYEKPHYDMMA
jgi:large repetitive protein